MLYIEIAENIRNSWNMDKITNEQLLKMNNIVASETMFYDNIVHTMDEIDDVLQGKSPSEIVRSCYAVNLDDLYFRMDDDGNITSYDQYNWTYDIDFSAIALYAIDNPDAFPVLQPIINECMEV